MDRRHWKFAPLNARISWTFSTSPCTEKGFARKKRCWPGGTGGCSRSPVTRKALASPHRGSAAAPRAPAPGRQDFGGPLNARSLSNLESAGDQFGDEAPAAPRGRESESRQTLSTMHESFPVRAVWAVRERWERGCSRSQDRVDTLPVWRSRPSGPTCHCGARPTGGNWVQSGGRRSFRGRDSRPAPRRRNTCVRKG